MKTRWEFFFENIGFMFCRVYEFKGEAVGPMQGLTLLKEDKIEFDLKFVPDDEPQIPGADQTGKLYIELPFDIEEAKSLAYHIAYIAQENVTFENGILRIHSGLITAKRIPETEQEELEVAETPYFAQVRFAEAPNIPSFNPISITRAASSQEHLRLITQYNAAKKSSKPIDRFLNLFKILEHLYSSRRKKSLREVLECSKELFESYAETFFQGESDESSNELRDRYSDFVERIIAARHNCAHLKSQSNFGYSHDDPRLKTEVEPLSIVLEELVYICVRKNHDLRQSL